MGENEKSMSFGVWIKTMLVECGMKQKDLAKIMGISEVSVSRWVNGGRTPKWDELDVILKYFGYHLEIVPNEFTR